MITGKKCINVYNGFDYRSAGIPVRKTGSGSGLSSGSGSGFLPAGRFNTITTTASRPEAAPR